MISGTFSVVRDTTHNITDEDAIRAPLHPPAIRLTSTDMGFLGQPAYVYAMS
jgi:hypothetical protein